MFIEDFLNRIKEKKILIIGDLMLDRYIWGKVSRISPEAPVPVVRVEKEELKLGGSANVLNNILSLNGNAKICGVIGDDLNGEKLLEILNKNNIDPSGIIIEKNRTTTVKTRIIGNNQQIVRVDRESDNGLFLSTFKKLQKYLENNIPEIDAVIISDYGKGVIFKESFELIINLCKRYNKIVNVDPKNQNMGIYKKPTLLTPNLSEASFAAGFPINFKNLKNGGNHLLKKFESDYLVITLADKGMAIFFKNKDEYVHLPTIARDVYDVTGAGDTVISVLTLGMAADFDVINSAKIANIAAGIVVGKLGAATVHEDELKKAWKQFSVFFEN